jgi:hypothetical protein
VGTSLVITMTTPSGVGTSMSDFSVTVAAPDDHDVHADLWLRGHDGHDYRGVPVKIRWRSGGSWRTLKSIPTSMTLPGFLKDVEGNYRARATKVVLSSGADICLKAESPTRENEPIVAVVGLALAMQSPAYEY